MFYTLQVAFTPLPALPLDSLGFYSLTAGQGGQAKPVGAGGLLAPNGGTPVSHLAPLDNRARRGQSDPSSGFPFTDHPGLAP